MAIMMDPKILTQSNPGMNASFRMLDAVVEAYIDTAPSLA